MSTPSIKGSIFMAAVDDVVRLRDAGGISRKQLESRLEAPEIALLAESLHAAAWYPLATYARLLALLGETEGGGREDYFRERGRATARRLMDTGVYQQLTFVERWGEDIRARRVSGAASLASFITNLKLVISMARAIYNVGEWVVEADPEAPDRVRVVISGAQDYSDPMRLAAEGFLNEGSRRKPQIFRSERPSEGRILFRMTVSVDELAAL